jgi:hypothetical protein
VLDERAGTVHPQSSPPNAGTKQFQHYGYGAVFTGVLLERAGLPLPGESLKIAAALYGSDDAWL